MGLSADRVKRPVKKGQELEVSVLQHPAGSGQQHSSSPPYPLKY